MTNQDPSETLNRRQRWPQQTTRTVGILGSLLALGVFISFFLADTYYARGLSQSKYGDFRQAYRDFRRAILLNPFEPAYHRDFAAFLAETVDGYLSENKEPQTAELVQPLAAEAGVEAAAALKLNPYNSLTLKSLLKTYYLLSRSYQPYGELAENLGETLLLLVPSDAQARYSVALVYAGDNKNARALELTREALKLKPDYPEAKTLENLLLAKEKRA